MIGIEGEKSLRGSSWKISTTITNGQHFEIRSKGNGGSIKLRELAKGPSGFGLPSRGQRVGIIAPVILVDEKGKFTGFYGQRQLIPQPDNQSDFPDITRIARASAANPEIEQIKLLGGDTLPTDLQTLPGVIEGRIGVSMGRKSIAEGDQVVKIEELLKDGDGLGLAALGLILLSDPKIFKELLLNTDLNEALKNGFNRLSNQNKNSEQTDNANNWHSIVSGRGRRVQEEDFKFKEGDQSVVDSFDIGLKGGLKIVSGQGAFYDKEGKLNTYPIPLLVLPDGAKRTFVIGTNKGKLEILVERRKRGGDRVVDASKLGLNNNGDEIVIGSIYLNSQRSPSKVELRMIKVDSGEIKDDYEWVPITSLRGKNRPGHRRKDGETYTDGESLVFAAVAMLALNGIQG
ncbi:MAG: hypothetical protein Fur009_7760 [Candidatus Microgenomates bacterium]